MHATIKQIWIGGHSSRTLPCVSPVDILGSESLHEQRVRQQCGGSLYTFLIKRSLQTGCRWQTSTTHFRCLTSILSPLILRSMIQDYKWTRSLWLVVTARLINLVTFISASPSCSHVSRSPACATINEQLRTFAQTLHVTQATSNDQVKQNETKSNDFSRICNIPYISHILWQTHVFIYLEI